MKEVLLFGISELSERIAYYIDCGESVKPFVVKGFVIDDAYYKEETFAGRKVYRYSEAKESFLSDTAIIICIGYKNMNENRKQIFYRLRDDGWDIESFISTHAIIHAEKIGTGNIFLCRSLIEYSSSMGDCNIFDSASLGHHSAIGSFNFFAANITGGNIKIGDCCFVGLNSTLKNSITLHNKTFVGAACYLSHSTPEEGLCYMPTKSVCVKNSELVMRVFTAH